MKWVEGWRLCRQETVNTEAGPVVAAWNVVVGVKQYAANVVQHPECSKQLHKICSAQVDFFK